jgi:tetratricopeptide (TPR) repeat protein
VHYSKGEYDKALENFQKSLGILLKLLPKDHPDVAQSYNNIGAVHERKAEYDKALEYYQKALAIRHKHLPEDRGRQLPEHRGSALLHG